MIRTKENTPLATLEAVTGQQIFDAVVAHAAQMPGRSAVDRGENRVPRCYYRSPTGGACFIGGILTDQEAIGLDDVVGSSDVKGLAKKGLLPSRLMPHLDLLQILQPIHDSCRMELWPDKLGNIADKLGFEKTSLALFQKAA